MTVGGMGFIPERLLMMMMMMNIRTSVEYGDFLLSMLASVAGSMPAGH